MLKKNLNIRKFSETFGNNLKESSYMNAKFYDVRHIAAEIFVWLLETEKNYFVSQTRCANDVKVITDKHFSWQIIKILSWETVRECRVRVHSHRLDVPRKRLVVKCFGRCYCCCCCCFCCKGAGWGGGGGGGGWESGSLK